MVNEPFHNDQIVNFLSPDFPAGQGNISLIKWLAATHAANPAAGRRINDAYVCAAVTDADSATQAYYKELLPWLMKNPAMKAADGTQLLTGFGCESHLVGSLLPAPTDMMKWYEWFGSMNLTVRVTEFDVVTGAH